VPPTAALALAAALWLGSAAPAPADTWSAPFRLAEPVSIDLLPAQIAFAPSGGAVIGFGEQDEDQPAAAQALIVSRPEHGRLAKPRPVPDAQAILDAGFDDGTLVLLTGTSEAGQACCSSASVIAYAGGRFGRPQTVTGTLLAGATVGRLLVLPGHVKLAAIGTAAGVWVAQSGRAGGLTRPRRLTAASASAQTLAASALSGRRSVVAWTASTGRPGAPNPRAIELAYGSATRAPSRPRAAVVAARGHEVDELQLAGGTLAWVESFYDGRGAYHSTVFAVDLSRAAGRPRPFAVSGQAAGLSLAADARGDALLAFKACGQPGVCTVYAAGRAAGGRFDAPLALGSIDASQAPAATVGASGEGLVGWIARGHVYAADRPPSARLSRTAGGASPRRGSSPFARARLVSAANYAADVTLAFSPSGGALAAWTQGTLNPSVMGAVYRPG